MCPQCYNALEANARFCGECGYTLPERIPACPTCGVPLEPSAKFCGECGMSLNAPVAGDSDAMSQKMRQMQDIKGQQEGWVNKIFKMLES
jgi:predicted amidophosphoribosyltransferase